MITINYTINTTVHDGFSKEECSYTFFGISALDENNNEIVSINDISSSRNDIELLINKFNENKLSLIHFYDAVEDFMAENN